MAISWLNKTTSIGIFDMGIVQYKVSGNQTRFFFRRTSILKISFGKQQTAKDGVKGDGGETKKEAGRLSEDPLIPRNSARIFFSLDISDDLLTGGKIPD